MKHDHRRRMIDEFAKELSQTIQLEGVNMKAVKKAYYTKLYARGLSATAVASWYRAIEARAREFANEGRAALDQVY